MFVVANPCKMSARTSAGKPSRSSKRREIWVTEQLALLATRVTRSPRMPHDQMSSSALARRRSGSEADEPRSDFEDDIGDRVPS